MSTKTKTTAAAAIAALALPTAAIAHDGPGKGKGHEKHGHDGPNVEQRSEDRGKDRSDHPGKHHGWGHGRGSVVLFGVDATGLTVTDGKLAGPITLDPVAANKKARKLLSLTKEKIKGEDTIQVGVAGDAVRVKYIGLAEGTAPAATDVVKLKGRVNRETGAFDIQKIHVVRPSADDDADDKTDKPGS